MSLIIRRHPYARFMNELIEQKNRELGRVNEFSNSFGLALDVTESDEAYAIVANLPGVKADAISVNIHDNVLSINAEVQESHEEENTRVLMRERRSGKYSRSLRFPVHVNGDVIEANFDNGVLTVRVPKAEEAKPRQILVNATSN